MPEQLDIAAAMAAVEAYLAAERALPFPGRAGPASRWRAGGRKALMQARALCQRRELRRTWQPPRDQERRG